MSGPVERALGWWQARELRERRMLAVMFIALMPYQAMNAASAMNITASIRRSRSSRACHQPIPRSTSPLMRRAPG